MELTQTYLKSILHYDPNTGLFFWLNPTSKKMRAGENAGHIGRSGYLRISINYTRYDSHRLSFLYMTGDFPPDHTDHINGNRLDNRWSNLRAVTSRENSRNTKRHKHNTSGVSGVSWNKNSGKWRAYIQTTRGNTHLGLFFNWFEAVCARKSGEVRYGYHANHGRIQI